MHQKLLYASVALAASLAVISYRLAERPTVVERPSLGGPPPAAFRAPNLVGKPMPSFEAVDTNGTAVGTETLRGRVVLLNVWATWCEPCRRELPLIEQDVWRKHNGEVAVVAVARGEAARIVREYNRKANLSFPLVPDPREKVSRLFGGNAPIPRTFVISRDGLVVHQSIGYSDRSFDELVGAVNNEVSRR